MQISSTQKEWTQKIPGGRIDLDTVYTKMGTPPFPEARSSGMGARISHWEGGRNGDAILCHMHGN